MARVVNISCYPAQPKAGEILRLLVILDNAAARDTTVSVEKQRIVKSVGGFPELRPTGNSYFDKPPLPIKVNAGEKTGISDPIVVKKDAQAGQGEPPVNFPEQVLFSAFIGQIAGGFQSVIALILSSVPD
jgi:hypothetical protein